MQGSAGVALADDPRPRLRPAQTGTRARNVAIDIVIALAGILPLLLTAHVPLTDLPNHLARQYIIRDWQTSPLLQSVYDVHWALVPNLALELFVLAARTVMTIDMAVRAFCIATILMLFAGTKMVNQAFSGPTARAYRVAPLLCYGGPFQYGFLSYCFGVGLALLLFAAALRLRGRPVWARATTLAASGFALLLCHLAAFGLFAIAVGVTELADAAIARGLSRRLPLALLRRGLVPVCALVPVFALFVWLSPTTDTVADNAVIFGSLHEKLRSFVSILYFTSPYAEIGLLALALATLAAGLLTRTIRWHPVGLAVVLAMTAIWLITPTIAMGAAFIAYRLPWAIAFFLVAALRPGPRYDRWIVPLAATGLVLAAVRIGLIAFLWLRWEPVLTALDAGLARLPAGARVMVIEGQPPGTTVPFRQPDLANVASYVVARRQGFEPGIFASLPGQLLFLKPHYLSLREQDGFRHAIPSSLRHIAPDYQYVLVLLPGLAHIAPDLPLVCQDQGPDFRLLKVVPAAEAHAGCP